ncbi:hypothetical protein PC129_g21769 [Phytophthora cactorum]|uniref:Uncharacterized protein n=1 Tax=Phytophthora cactorum TaxID=29920 RepID=A0A329RMH0_9STRA|nr:hypothetical protein PC111_g19197 [Phytophthora cactorum]KAG2875016.1 hypothetical protein PC114_g24955 [Phytophthora cactorum]KAG2887516.1 hypothetical protein PC115_g20302 [Phytophthora cactorum]KAG2931425.1 hypothetical protein PC117_g13469 [Phytophthora cactorum]KAG2960885.1 hypothetical protein PC118_g22267 [Phytophthora cactorum]
MQAKAHVLLVRLLPKLQVPYVERSAWALTV